MADKHLSGFGPAGNANTADVISDLVTNGSIELSSTPLEQIAAGATLLPFGTSVYVPSPQQKPLASNLEIVSSLHKAGMEAVPHIAARKIRSRNDLEAYLAQVVRSQTMPEEWQVLHTNIAKAIRSRNAELAAQLIEKDISWGVETFESFTNSDKA